jgi:hypothetical protein
MKAFEALRIIFASYEALFLSIILASYFYYPAIFVGIGNNFQTNNEIWKFIPSIPLVVCSFSVQYAWKILMPLESSSNRILHEWPNYWKLKLRVIFSVILCAACVISSVYIWFFSGTLSSLNVGAIFISSIIVSLTVAFNQFLAAFKIRELMEP